MPYFTEEQKTTWHNSLPAVPLSVKAAFYNAEGKILIVKPNYKPGWQMVGGIVDADEPPLTALIRETHEEIGLKISEGRFTYVSTAYNPPRGKRIAMLYLVFACHLTEAEVASIKIQTNELNEYKFMHIDTLLQEAPGTAPQAIIALHDANRQTGYIEGNELKAVGE